MNWIRMQKKKPEPFNYVVLWEEATDDFPKGRPCSGYMINRSNWVVDGATGVVKITAKRFSHWAQIEPPRE